MLAFSTSLQRANVDPLSHGIALGVIASNWSCYERSGQTDGPSGANSPPDLTGWILLARGGQNQPAEPPWRRQVSIHIKSLCSCYCRSTCFHEWSLTWSTQPQFLKGARRLCPSMLPCSPPLGFTLGVWGSLITSMVRLSMNPWLGQSLTSLHRLASFITPVSRECSTLTFSAHATIQWEETYFYQANTLPSDAGKGLKIWLPWQPLFCSIVGLPLPSLMFHKIDLLHKKVCVQAEKWVYKLIFHHQEW